MLQNLPRLVLQPTALTVFTHGPGVRTVLACALLRCLSRSRLVWVATRPDLTKLPAWLKGRRTAHAVICNRPRPDLQAAAADARIIAQPIGISPERMAGEQGGKWPHLAAHGVPIAVHVGHLRRSRGLERLCEIKAILGDKIEIVVVASPYFEPAPGLMEELTAAGVHVDRGLVPKIAEVYRSADLYLFPAPPESEGAIELPLSVLEAMACRVPVISTPFGALPEAVAGAAGVRFATSENFAAAVADWFVHRSDPAQPEGLPPHLDAHRLADRIQELCEETR